MKRALESLTEVEFNTLKASGLLWEFYPDAPEVFEDIQVHDCHQEEHKNGYCMGCGE